MLAYFRNRLSEPTTWIGIPVFVAGLALFWFYRQDVYSALVTAIGGAIAALAERFMTDPFRALLALIRPATPLAEIPRSTPKMSALSDFLDKAMVDAVTAFVTNSDLGVEEKALASAIVAAWQAPSVSTVVTALEDALKVVSDLKAQVAAAQAPQILPQVEDGSHA